MLTSSILDAKHENPVEPEFFRLQYSLKVLNKTEKKSWLFQRFFFHVLHLKLLMSEMWLEYVNGDLLNYTFLSFVAQERHRTTS